MAGVIIIATDDHHRRSSSPLVIIATARGVEPGLPGSIDGTMARYNSLMTVRRLPPTTTSLFDDDARPYFLWWTDETVGTFKQRLGFRDPEERAYWMGALLREAKTRDVRLFIALDEVRALWPRLIPYLGHSREMWACRLRNGLRRSRSGWSKGLGVSLETRRASKVLN